MLFRVQCNLLFESEDEARNTFRDLKLALSRAITLNPFLSIRQESFVEWHRCSHADDTGTPCDVIERQESP